MVQNPHRQPEIHPGAEGGGSGEYGRASRHWASHGTRGRRPDNLQTNFARNFPRSLFETTRKRCNSNDVDSTFELNAWELRATLMGGGRAWPSFATTRRRHAEGRLLMVQNPHRQPEIHPGAEGGGSGEYGRASRHWASHGTRGRRPDNLQTNFARNFPRSLFETTRKRCNSNDVDSTFEVNAWELRATLMGGGRDWPSFETTRRRHAEGRLLMVQNPHHCPWCHAPSRIQCSPTG